MLFILVMVSESRQIFPECRILFSWNCLKAKVKRILYTNFTKKRRFCKKVTLRKKEMQLWDLIYHHHHNIIILYSEPDKDGNRQIVQDLLVLLSSWPSAQIWMQNYLLENANNAKWQVPNIWYRKMYQRYQEFSLRKEKKYVIGIFQKMLEKLSTFFTKLYYVKHWNVKDKINCSIVYSVI